LPYRSLSMPVRALRRLCLPLVLLCPAAASARPPLMPPQLLAACQKLAVGAPCSVRFEGKQLSGACQELPDHSRACLPEHGGKKRGSKPKPAP
jgi:hypothetical protein